MKMVLVDCAIQNGSADIVAEYEITNKLCTKGILTRVDTIRTEFSQPLSSKSATELNSSHTSNNSCSKLVKSITLPSLSNLPRVITIEEPFRSKSGAYVLSSDLIQEINSNHSRASLRLSKSSTQLSKSKGSENLESNCLIISVPPAKRNKTLIRLPWSSCCKTDAKSFFEENPSFLKLLSHNLTLRKWVSEPCFFFENEKKEKYLYQQQDSEKLRLLVENIPMLKPLEMETKKSTSKLTNGTSRSKNCTKNVQIMPPKPSNSEIRPKPSRITRPSVFELRRKKTKTTQGTQVELQTKEAESQTYFKKDTAATDRPLRLKKETSPIDEKDCTKPLKKTAVTPFSFMERCQAHLERKHQRAIHEKQYELKRWARPPLILHKKPYKIVIPASKLTIPKSVSFETDRRREKWENYMKEFQQRQEKLEHEKQSVKQTELRKFRKTLIPEIHKVPYKKLGIKPRKPITSPFKKLRDQSKEYKKKQIKSRYAINDKKSNSENNKINTKLNKKHTKINKSNLKQSKQKSTKTKMYNKNTNNSINHQMTITINEKNNSNVKNLPSPPNRNNIQIKISSPNRNEIRRNYCSLLNNNIRGNQNHTRGG